MRRETGGLVSLGKLEDLNRAQAAAEGIERRREDVARLVRSAAESDVVHRAVSSCFWREALVAVMIEGSVLKGYVDLIYERDGGLGMPPARLAQPVMVATGPRFITLAQ